MSLESNTPIPTVLRANEEDVRDFLEELDLSMYLNVFLSEGFDTMKSIQEITEEDLEHMRVKRGHRRVIQRALFKAPMISDLDPAPPTLTIRPRSSLSDTPDSIPKFNTNACFPRPTSQSALVDSSKLAPINVQGSCPLDSVGLPPPCVRPNSPPGQVKQKRKYRRHPKPDLNAPEKPLSAYVMFSNMVRESLKGKNVSFTEIARIVGERWKTLDQPTRDSFESRALDAKNNWKNLMAAYQLTPEYEEYRRYLQRFKESQPNLVTVTNKTNNTCEGSINSPSAEVQTSPADGTSREISWEDTGADRYYEECTNSSPNSTSSNPLKRRFSNHELDQLNRKHSLSIAPVACYTSLSSRSLSPPFHLPPPGSISQKKRPTIPRLDCLDEKFPIPQSRQSPCISQPQLPAMSGRRRLSECFFEQ